MSRLKFKARILYVGLFIFFVSAFSFVGIVFAQGENYFDYIYGDITQSTDIGVKSESELNALREAISREDANWLENAYMFFNRWEEDDWAAVAWKTALGEFLNRLAYDTATYLATGDKGQAPMFQTDSLSDFVTNAIDYAAGDALEELGDSGVFGSKFNVCSPSANVRVMIGLGIQREYRPRDPDCTFTEMMDNWEDELNGPDFLNRFSNMFDPKQNVWGIAMTVRSGVSEQVDSKANNMVAEYLKDGGWNPVKSLISDKIATPASLVEAKAFKTLDSATVKEKTFTGNILADAISTFANTLIGKLASQWFGRGLVSRFPDNSYQGDWGGFDSYDSTSYLSGIRGAKERFKSLIEPNFKVRGDYDILGELTSCPDPTKAGPTNCVVPSSFSQAVSSNMTVGQAMKDGYLNPNGVFGFTVDGLEPSYIEGYPYRSMIILRKFRIVPVGWELAAQYIKDNGNLVPGTKNLEDLIDCFSKDDEYDGYYADWCVGLVDPSWVLKAPLNYCKKEGPGPEILSQQVVGTGDDSRVALSRNNEYCADEQSCIKENQDGSCELYGYCTEERRKWDFNAESCDPIYNTCQTFRSRDGKTVSYLENGLDYGNCSIENVGCLDYCEDFDDSIDYFTCTKTTGNKMFFDKDADDCDESSEGCHEFIRTKPGIGSNLFYDSSFENYVIGDVTPNWEVVDDGRDGMVALKLVDDFSTSFDVGPSTYQLAGQSFVFSIYAKECSDGDFLQLETATTSIVSTDDWRRYVVSYTYPKTSFGNTISDIKVDISGTCIIDSIKLERGDTATSYSDYRDDGLVYQKLAPDYLGCNTASPSAMCDDFTRTCTYSEVGCELYTSSKDKMSIPAKVVAQDYCTEECVDYNSYFQSETSFDSLEPAYLIPRLADRCSAVSVGCDEFTNLDKIGEDAEKREFYSYLRQCVKPNDIGVTCSEFYTWEGSNETGYQLRVHALKADADGSPSTTEDDSAECNRAIYNLPATDPGYNPDCREFYNEDGELFYNLYSKTLSCVDNCHPYRRTEDNLVDYSICQSECDDAVCENNCVSLNCSDPASDGKQSCNYDASAKANDSIFCKNNGKWSSQHGACLYNAVPGEGKSCSASSVGCREYTGSAGSNVRIVLNSDFEGSLQNWEGLDGTTVDISEESLIVGGESLDISEGANVAAVNVSGYVQEGKAYYLSFLAKAASTASFDILGIGVDTSDLENFTQEISSSVDLNSSWQIFKFNLSNLNHEISADEKLIISADGDFFIDDVRLTEITDRYYLIKNSWTIPESCYYDINGKYVGEETNLGCASYYDRERNNHYLHSFSQLCADSAVGCELMIDTQNYTSNEGNIWNDVDGDNTCTAADGADCVEVSGDAFKYVVFDDDKRCSPADKGCQIFGLPYVYGDDVAYDKTFIRNNPDNYSQILCDEDVVDCEEWSIGNSMSYFKDPGDQVCEWRQSYGDVNSKWAWYKKKVKRCDADSDGAVLETDDYCRDSSDCPIGVSCSTNTDCGAGNSCVSGACYNSCVLDNKDRDCYTDFSTGEIKTIGLGGNGNSIEQPTMDDSGTVQTSDDVYWVGMCPASQSGCSEYIDPISSFNSNLLYNGDFTQNVDAPDVVADGWGTAVNGVQNVNLEPNTMYVMAVEGGNSMILDGGGLAVFNILDPVTNSFTTYIDKITLSGFPATRRSISFYTADTVGDAKTSVTVSDALASSPTKVELKEIAIDYQLEQNVDKETCNGVIDFEEGCILFNERAQNNTYLSNLIWDADKTVYDASGVNPKTGDPAHLDSNVLLKVTPDRACNEWLTCRSFVKDDQDNNVCFDIGLCDSVDDNGNCNNFVVSEKENLEVPSPGLDFSNMSGYAKVGLTGNSLSADLYSLGAMEQMGEVVNISNGDFEIYGSNKYPLGWTPFSGSWNENYFSVVNNPIAAQMEGIDYAVSGKGFLKFGSENKNVSPVSEFFDLEPNLDYVISFYSNTKNFKGKNNSVVKFYVDISFYDSVSTELGSQRLIIVDSGEDWELHSSEFETGSDVVRARIHLAGTDVDNGDCVDNEHCSGNIYVDDVKIKPALENRKGDFTEQVCRLYPETDSLSCEYFEDSGSKRKGWPGYCLEYDRYPGNEDACLLWYPIDRVKGDGIEEGGGYIDRFPLYYSTEAVEDDPLVYPIPDDIYLKATTPQPGACTLGDYLVKCYAGSEIPLDDGSTLNLGATECGNWIIAKVVNSFPEKDLFSRDMIDSIRYTAGSDWPVGILNIGDFPDETYMVTEDRDKIYMSVLFDENDVFEELYLAYGDFSTDCDNDDHKRYIDVIFYIKNFYASEITQVVTPVGQNKFWSGRVYGGSDFATPCNDSIPFLDQVCTYLSDYKPFGSVVPPGDSWDVVSNPYEWDGRSGEGFEGYQPLYFEKPKGQARAGQLHDSGDVKDLFAQSYGTWVWDTAQERYIKSDSGGWSPPTNACNTTGLPPRAEAGMSIATTTTGYINPPDSLIITPDVPATFIPYVKGPENVFWVNQTNKGDYSAGFVYTYNTLVIPGGNYEVRNATGRDFPAWIDENNEDYLSIRMDDGPSASPDEDIYTFELWDLDTEEMVFDWSGLVDKDLYVIFTRENTITELVIAGSNDFCGIAPRVDDDYDDTDNMIRVNSESGDIFVETNDFVNLTFNSLVDSQQMPLVMYGVDWGDNETTVVSGAEMRDRPNTDNPHSFYHLYSYWDMKAKNSIDQDVNSVYCGPAGGNAVNNDLQDSGIDCPANRNCCAVQPGVKIKDNWGWCSNGVNGDPCPAGGYEAFDGWIVVLEK